MSTSSLAGLPWRTSSYSNAQSNCVKVAPAGSGSVAVRDSKDRDGGVLVVAPDRWAAFTSTVRDGYLPR